MVGTGMGLVWPGSGAAWADWEARGRVEAARVPEARYLRKSRRGCWPDAEGLAFV